MLFIWHVCMVMLHINPLTKGDQLLRDRIDEKLDEMHFTLTKNMLINMR